LVLPSRRSGTAGGGATRVCRKMADTTLTHTSFLVTRQLLSHFRSLTQIYTRSLRHCLFVIILITHITNHPITYYHLICHSYNQSSSLSYLYHSRSLVLSQKFTFSQSLSFILSHSLTRVQHFLLIHARIYSLPFSHCFTHS
jgi:hypothetical protein